MKLKEILTISITLTVAVFINASQDTFVPASLSKKERVAQLIRTEPILRVNNIGHWQSGQWALLSPCHETKAVEN